MQRMEESTISFPTLYAILDWSMLLGGLAVSVLVLRHHHRNPPDREQCTATILQRAWPTRAMGILLCCILLVYLLASATGQFFYEEQLPLVRLVATLLIYLALVAAIFTINRQRGLSREDAFGIGPGRTKALACSPLLYLAIIPFLMVATKGYHAMLHYWLGQEITMQDAAQAIAQETSWLEAGYILAAIVVAPVYEELLFRGILFPYLAKRIGMAGSIAIVSILFALIHFHVPSIMPLFLLSTALCLAYWRTGSLWTSIGIHATFNAVGTLAIKLAY